MTDKPEVSARDTTVQMRSDWPHPPEPGELSEPQPERIGPYAVIEPLGRGGMGEVFLADDPVLHRRIALKRVRPDKQGSSELRRRFQLEARVTARLQHPSIIPVYNWCGEGDELYYTMRPVEGMSLAELLRGLRADLPGSSLDWPLARLLRLFLQACHAVAFAHSKGVIHRDLKPSNIMIGAFEEVLVLDWGMAKVLADSSDSSRLGALPALAPDEDTASNLLVGTPAYIAPELYDREPASPASDIFSLGVILYELLTLEMPWQGREVLELQVEMRGSPPQPRPRPGRSFPPRLAEVALRALQPLPARRYVDVRVFAGDVADALEGRAAWRRVPGSRRRDDWRLLTGGLRVSGQELLLRPKGRRGSFRYFHNRRFHDNVRVELEFYAQRGRPELQIWLNARDPNADEPGGYCLAACAGRRRMLALLRAGRDVAGAQTPEYAKGRWHTVVASREEHRVSLSVNGEEIYAYSDPIPLGSGLVGITGRGHGLRVRGLTIRSRDAGLTVSCLAVPDAFYNRRLFEDAREHYQRIAASHPGRREGRLAGFRGGLCLLELARAEEESELKALVLDEAQQSFRAQAEEHVGCLADLGRAMVAAERGDTSLKHEALAAALVQRDDPHRATAREWLLSRLHSLDAQRRRGIAELLPLAIEHCFDGWGQRLIRQEVNEVRGSWEFPSFMSSRIQGRSIDPVWRAEARLFFAFWTARPRAVERAFVGLLHDAAARPYHLPDAYFALLELGFPERAARLLEGASRAIFLETPERARNARLCHAVQDALAGSADAVSALAGLELHPSSRPCNSARLWVARAAFARGEPGMALEALKALDAGDSFAREHRAWFLLRMGELGRAEKELSLFVRRNDHRHGRNLANFLVGAHLLGHGRAVEARELFGCLRARSWPRTWTLGSRVASGKWTETVLREYLQSAFFWEKRQLRAQLTLLAEVCSLPEERERFTALAALVEC